MTALGRGDDSSRKHIGATAAMLDRNVQVMAVRDCSLYTLMLCAKGYVERVKRERQNSISKCVQRNLDEGFD